MSTTLNFLTREITEKLRIKFLIPTPHLLSSTGDSSEPSCSFASNTDLCFLSFSRPCVSLWSSSLTRVWCSLLVAPSSSLDFSSILCSTVCNLDDTEVMSYLKTVKTHYLKNIQVSGIAKMLSYETR